MSDKGRLGPHDHMLLDRWGRQLYDAFHARPYLVGSLARHDPTWKDVDVRICLPDDAGWLVEFEDMVAAIQSIRLRTINLAVTLWGRQVTGLPIDFQFQPADEFHAADGEVRSALGISVEASVREAWDRRSDAESGPCPSCGQAPSAHRGGYCLSSPSAARPSVDTTEGDRS